MRACTSVTSHGLKRVLQIVSMMCQFFPILLYINLRLLSESSEDLMPFLLFVCYVFADFILIFFLLPILLVHIHKANQFLVMVNIICFNTRFS